MVVEFSIKNLLLVLFTAIVCYVIYASRQVILVSIFGILTAFILNPLVEKLMRFKIPRWGATLIVLFISLLLIFIAGLFVIPSIIEDIEIFSKQLPGYASWIFTKVTHLASNFGINISTKEHYQQIGTWVGKYSDQILSWAGSMAGSVQHAFSVTINLLIIPILAFVILADYTAMKNFIDKYLGVDKTRGTRKYLEMFSTVMASYFRGQFTVVIVLCFLYSIALYLTGLNAALLLGMLTGLLSLVPFLGFTIGILVSTLMAVIQFQDFIHPFYVLLGYGVVQVIDTLIVTPGIVGDSLGLHPVATMIILLIGGSSFGIVGMIFALPIAAIMLIIYKESFSKKINPDFVDSPVRGKN